MAIIKGYNEKRSAGGISGGNQLVPVLVQDIKDFIDYFTEYIDKHMFTMFKKDKDRKVCDAINVLFKRRENLEIFNKKALYIYIREITNVETPVITKVTKILKKLYKKLYLEYKETGYIRI